MFRPQIQKTRILAILALLNVVMVYWALNSYERHRTFGFDIKNQSVEVMESAINSLRKVYIQKVPFQIILLPRFLKYLNKNLKKLKLINNYF